MIFFIIRISSKKEIMGEFKNKKIGNILGWFAFGFLSLVSITTIILLFK